ncbi:MAG: C25 family cysteine peptidase [Candidatus Glassbacteria bacterium]
MLFKNTAGILRITCAISILLTSAALASASWGFEEGFTYGVRFTAEFSEEELVFHQVAGYDLITLRDASVTSELGKPVLPVQMIRVAIPAGTRAVDVHGAPLHSVKIPGSFNVIPGQQPVSTREERPQTLIEPDREFYNSKQSFPSELALLDHQSDLAGQEIAWIRIYPLQYLPEEKSLVFHDLIEVTVRCRENASGMIGNGYNKFPESQRRHYQEMLEALVINPNDIELYPPSQGASFILPPGDFEHVVITSEEFAEDFQPLVEWNTKKGVKDTVVTVSWIYDNYTGPGDTLKIRQFIIDANSNWGTMYFLLGGGNSTVPFAYRYYYGSYPSQITPSDQYYSDFDDDWTHDVYVGRASAEESYQATVFVNKVLKYEKDPPLTDYPLDILLIGMDADASTPFEDLKETIYGYIPSSFNVTKVYDSDSGNHRDDVIAALNAGQNLVNHADHSGETIMGTGWLNHGLYIDNAYVDYLNNDDRMSIIVSWGCLANAMDFDPMDCIAEHFVIMNSNEAGVAFTGNTRMSYYSVGDPETLSGQLDRDWWQGVFIHDQNELGKALVWSKLQFNEGEAWEKHCEWTFNLLGEPSMPIWLDTPADMDVTHQSSMPVGIHEFIVEVTDGIDPLEGARVCIMKKTEVYEVAYTGPSGEATFFVEFSSPGTMDVTVTAPDFLPYEGVCRITPPIHKIPIPRW